MVEQAQGATSTTPEKDRRHLGSRALRAAQSQLVERYPDEFNKLLGDEREKVGLPRDPGPVKKVSRLDKLREQLRQQGVEPIA